MAGRKGNKNAVKLKEHALKKEAYDKFCQWLSKGKSPYSFTFKKGDIRCTGETILSYIKEDSVVFPPIHKEFAFAQGYAKWEELVEQSADGTNKKANTASLQMVMRNKFKWDAKTQVENELDPQQQRQSIVIEQEIQRRVEAALHERAIRKSDIPSQQHLLDKGQRREEDSFSDELGAKGTIRESSHMQHNSQSETTRNNDVFLSPFA